MTHGKTNLVKSISDSQDEILRWIMQLYAPDGFDLDPTYSKGVFYKSGKVPQPKLKFDLHPQTEDTEKAICRSLPFAPGTIKNIVFDPPFMFGTHGQTKNNRMNKRFTMFDSFSELCTMYLDSLLEFRRILKKGGYLFFKCQDYTDSKTTMTHCLVYQWATEIGFYPEDLFILIASGGWIYNPKLQQRHARKFHSYWWIFKKR